MSLYDEVPNSKLEIVSTAFPYAYGVPHIGNLTQACKADVLNKLRNSFYKNLKTRDVVSVFPYSYHLTGLPTYLRVLQLQEQYDLKKNLNEFDESKLLNDYLAKKNLSLLNEFVSSFEDLSTPQRYLLTLNKYYTRVFKKLNLDTNLPKYHTTTDLDSGYHTFVNLIYQKIFEKGVVLEGVHHLVCCNRCKNVLGDHDRVKFEGIGLYQLKVLRTKTGLALEGEIDPVYVQKLQGVGISKQLYEYLESRSVKRGPLILALNSEKYQLNFETPTEEFSHETSEPVEPITLYYTLKQIQCRCGGLAQIVAKRTLLLNFEDPVWKEQVQLKIRGSSNCGTVKQTLLKNSRDLRCMAFLRERGYGSRLTVLKNTEYENMIVDSLMDSFLHPLYYGIWLKVKNPEALRSEELDVLVNSFENPVHVCGKDLLSNHVLLLCYFHTLLYPNKRLPYFETSRFIVASDRNKMSKSLNNVVYFEELQAAGISGRDFKFYLCSMTDDNAPVPLDFDKVKLEGKIGTHHFEDLKEILSKLDVNNPVFESFGVQNCLREIASNLEVNLGEKEPFKSESSRKFQLRSVSNKILNDLRKQLKKTKRSNSSKDDSRSALNLNVKKVIEGFLEAFL